MLTPAQDLIAQGYRQVSRKYRQLARLPPGESGVAAMRRLGVLFEGPEAEYRAADFYRRVHASAEGHVIQLDEDMFDEYLAEMRDDSDPTDPTVSDMRRAARQLFRTECRERNTP